MMFKLGFFVFSSIMFFYVAWTYQKLEEKRRLQEWITMTTQQLDDFQHKTPLGVISSIFSKLFGFIIPKGIAAQQVRNRLNWGGFEKVEVEIYFTIRILLAMIPILLYPLMLGMSTTSYLLGVGIGGALYMMPEFLLNGRIARRSISIEKELLPITELLVTSTQAGLDIGTAMFRITNVKQGHLSSLLRQGFQYMGGVMTREEAYHWIIAQTKVESLHMFIESIMQSEKYGTKLSDTLRDQLTRIRNDIQNQGIAKAQAANGKMMLPTLIFIFLPLLIIVLGPQVLALKGL